MLIELNSHTMVKTDFASQNQKPISEMAKAVAANPVTTPLKADSRVNVRVYLVSVLS